MKVRLTCSLCGVVFERHPHKVRAKNGHYCSWRCFALDKSAVLRANPELADMGQRLTRDCLVCGESFAFKPKRINSARYCSRRCQLVGGILPDYRGEANPNYRHGQSRSAVYQLMKRWAEKKCAICGWDISVDIHHIVPIREGGKNTDDNLILLCPNHHRMADMGLLSREEMREAALKLLPGSPVLRAGKKALLLLPKQGTNL